MLALLFGMGHVSEERIFHKQDSLLRKTFVQTISLPLKTPDQNIHGTDVIIIK
jgi:hypothetical protein